VPRIRITDARVEEVRGLCLTLLENLLITEMEATYGATWTQIIKVLRIRTIKNGDSSVADPNPDPDPHVFGPPGSGSIIQRYGFGSGSKSGDPSILKQKY
jgi:hypothetical protein